MGFSASGAKSSSTSGLTGELRRDELSEDLFAQSQFVRNLANQFVNSDPRAINVRGQRFTGQGIFPLNDFLLPVGTERAIGALSRLGFNQVSGGGALRGQLRPDFTPGVIGSTVQNLSAQLLPLMVQMAQFQRLLPEQLKASRLGFAERPLLTAGPLVGSQSNFNSFGFGAQIPFSGGGSNPVVMG